MITGVSTAALTETNAAQSTGGTLVATDPDSSNAFVVQTNAAGSNGFGTFSIDAGGVWTYTMNNAHDEFVGGTDYTDSITVATADGTSQLITVTLHGTDDATVITGTSTAELTETNAAQSTGGTLVATDPDSSNAFVVQTNAAGSNGFGTFSIDAGGVWTYTMNNAHDEFVGGTDYTDSITVATADGTSQLITVTIHGTDDATVITGTSTAALTETNAAQSTGGTLVATDPDSSNAFVVQTNAAGSNGFGTFSIDAGGVWTYTMNNAHDEFVGGTDYTDSITVATADGTSQLITVTIHGTDDAPIAANDTSANLGAVAATEKSGTLNGSGGNNGSGNVLTNDTDVDSASLTVSAIRTGGAEGAGTGGSLGVGLVGAHGTLTIAANGSYTYVVNENDLTVQALNTGGSTTDTFNYTVSDGSLTDTAVLTVTINGANDAPVGANDTSASAGAIAATEKSGTLNGSGGNNGSGNVLTNDSDVDSASLTVSAIRTGGVEGAGSVGSVGVGLVGAHGTLTLNSNGSYTYVVNENDATVQALNTGGSTTDTFNYTVSDGSLTDTAVLTVTINGANDAAAISGTKTGTVVEAAASNGSGTPTATGTLTDTDVDNTPNTFIASSGTTGHGSYTMTAAGVWTYTLNNADLTVNALNTGQSLPDVFTVTTVDGTQQVVNITIQGTSDAQLISSVVNSRQGDANTPTIVTIQFSATGVTQTFANVSDPSSVVTLSNPSKGTLSLVANSGVFDAAHGTYSFQVDKVGGNNGSSFDVSIAAGAFKDASGNTNSIATGIGLKPAGTSGEPINLALTDPSHEGALITVTVKDVPSGWTIDGATHNADGSWTTQTNDLHGLTVTTPVSFTGAAVLDVQMTWTNADGTLGSASIADNVEAYAPGSPIFAWSGDDVLTGSSGNDLFVFSQPIGADTVHNFDAAADQIDLIGYNGLADFADLQTHIADDAHGNAVITLGDGQSITLDGVHSGALTAGNFVFDQTPVVNNAGTMTIGDGALLPLSGMINNSGLISLDSTGGETLLQIIQHGVTLQGGGQILLSDSAANVISGTGPDVTLVNVDNTISGAGQLGGGMLSLDNQGTIIASGANALVIDTGGSVVTNSGTLEATGSGGLTITGGLANSGMLLANGGDIVIHGQVTGDGDATIGNLSKLEFGSASSTDVTFAHDAAGTLQLDDSFDFSGRIGGITNDDRLELEDILFGAGTTAVYQANQDGSGGTLTVSDGTHGTALHLVGSYDANGFKLADDGQGHTAVSYNPAEFTLTGVGNGAISSDFVV
nr:VCBS domain-containing protein [Mesorhizobium ciceri]